MRAEYYKEILKFADPFPKKKWPAISCQKCGFGQVQVIPGKLELFESYESIKLKEEKDLEWDPEWISGLFLAQLRCSDLDCQTLYLATGSYRGDVPNKKKASDPDYQELLTLISSVPAFPITDRLPSGTPEEIHQRINDAAAIIWRSPSAAGNRLRLAIEELLTYLNIPSNKPTGGRLTTQDRIDIYKANGGADQEFIEAVKWLGNQGSHGDSLNAKDVILGVQLLHEALKTIFPLTRLNAVREAAAIISSKGIPKKKAK